MATPLFVESLETMKSQLRLSGVPAGRDANEIISDAVLEAKVGFYRKLGEGRVSYLLGVTYTENPTSSAERLRVIANLTEVKWCRLILMRTLPVMFMDGNNATLQTWNEESAFRGMTREDILLETKRLENEITENLDLLSGSETFGNETSIRGTMFEPEDGGFSVGDTIWS